MGQIVRMQTSQGMPSLLNFPFRKVDTPFQMVQNAGFNIRGRMFAIASTHIFEYDQAGDKWMNRGTVPFPLSSLFGSVELGDRFYIIGGHNDLDHNHEIRPEVLYLHTKN